MKRIYKIADIANKYKIDLIMLVVACALISYAFVVLFVLRSASFSLQLAEEYMNTGLIDIEKCLDNYKLMIAASVVIIVPFALAFGYLFMDIRMDKKNNRKKELAMEALIDELQSKMMAIKAIASKVDDNENVGKNMEDVMTISENIEKKLPLYYVLYKENKDIRIYNNTNVYEAVNDICNEKNIKELAMKKEIIINNNCPHQIETDMLDYHFRMILTALITNAVENSPNVSSIDVWFEKGKLNIQNIVSDNRKWKPDIFKWNFKTYISGREGGIGLLAAKHISSAYYKGLSIRVMPDNKVKATFEL